VVGNEKKRKIWNDVSKNYALELPIISLNAYKMYLMENQIVGKCFSGMQESRIYRHAWILHFLVSTFLKCKNFEIFVRQRWFLETRIPFIS